MANITRYYEKDELGQSPFRECKKLGGDLLFFLVSLVGEKVGENGNLQSTAGRYFLEK